MRNPFAPLFERRSIGSPHELLTYLLRGHETASGQTVNEATAFNVATVLTCVSLRSRALASLPIRVYERIDERNKRPAVNHPVSRVLFKPNTWQTRSELFGMLEAHRALRGNAYAWINRVTVMSPDGIERGQVAELVPMHPDQIEVLDENPDILGEETAYRLHKRNGQIVPFAASEVLHLKGLSTNGRTGRSPLTDLRESIGGALATQEHSNSLWSRDATPSVTLQHPKTLSDKARKNLEDSWQETYGRGKNKKRVAVLEEGMTIEQLSLSPEDGQFLETRKFLRSEIAGAFHVPPHMIGDTEKTTSWGTGIEQQQIGFLVFTLRPDLVIWEQRLTLDLVTRPEKYFMEFSLEGFLRGDVAARGQFYRVMREIGAYSANDVRAFENMNPIPNGDDYLRPTNLQPLGMPQADPGGNT